MNRRQALGIYDEEYAAAYDDKFSSKKYRVGSDNEAEIVKKLLAPGRQWLDVGCGTGYLLGRFPGVPRAGLDLSPAMLNVARQANPDALFFRQGDFVDDVPEWKGRWGLVTSMWYAYCLVESLSEVERVVENLAHWTSDDGVCFVPLCDPALLGHGVRLPYINPNPLHGGSVTITGVTWTWREDSGTLHKNMIAPQLDYMVALFEQHFQVTEIIEYPSVHADREPLRKAIVAKSKRPALL